MSGVRRRANPLSVDPESLIEFAKQVDQAVRELDSIEWPKRPGFFLDLVDEANGHGSAFAGALRTLATGLRKYG